MKKIKFLRRTGMFLLFLGALYTTLTTITNITFTDMKVFAQEARYTGSKVTDSYFGQLSEKKVMLKDKTLNFEKAPEKYISSEQIEGPKTLAEAINFEQYPSTTVVATGYTAGVESTGKTPNHPQYGITYSGVKVKRDLYSTIAADLSVYPIGTIMYIPGYGFGVVADKGGAINGNEIDLYYPTVEDVYNEWGKKEVEVYIIEKGDGSLSEKTLQKLNENEALQVFRKQITKS